ncbi:MAG: SMR family transporter [Roseococcus sp.]
MNFPASLWSLPPALLLWVAILAEVIATVSLKLAEGFTRPWPLVAVAVGYAIAFFLLSAVLETLPVGIVYAIWAGSGVAGAALAGALLFGERIGLPEIAGFLLIILGVVLLTLRARAH